jgi:DNA mismatch endonuclease (patch repair protein)
LHVKDLPGKPDIVLPRYRAVVLVNGCFWHGHDCALFKWPSTRPEWWRTKIERNRANDERSQQMLKRDGWDVAVIWECALKGRERIAEETVSDRLVSWLREQERSPLVIRGTPLANPED